MKRKSFKTVIRIAAYALVTAAAFCVIAFASGSGKSENTAVKNPISFSSAELPQGSRIVAENKSFILSADLSKTSISLTDRESGAVFTSSPQDAEQREDLKNAVKLEVSSLLDIKYADRDSNVTRQNSVAGCLNKNTVSARLIENGVRFDFYFSAEGFLIPLEITLSENGMIAKVPLSEIEEESGEVKLISLSVLPNFGACGLGGPGYMLVPDGSGAVISYDSYDTEYSQRVYGSDPAVSQGEDSISSEQIARLPVFGATDLSKAFIGLITSGDTRANIHARTANEKNPYAAVCAEFIYREKISVEVSQQTFESTQANLFEPEHCALESFSVEYRMPQKPDYVGMANTYRDYLINDVGISPVSQPVGALQLKLIGGIMHTENFLGVPVRRVLPVTTYDDAAGLSEHFSKLGVDRLCINYLDWYQDGTDSKLTLKIAPESRLGGKKALESMMKTLSSGGQIYLNLNFTSFCQSQNGYSVKYDSARNVLQEPLGVYSYYLTTYQKNSELDPVILLKPSMIQKASGQFLSAVGDFAEYRYSINGMSSTIYSDFAKSSTDRGVMRQVFTGVMSEIEKATGGLLFNSANAYAFPYAQVLQGVPTESSGFLCESGSVPFYAFALHGLVQMGTSPVNASASPDDMRLKALECGISTAYTLGLRNTNQFKNTAASDYSYLDAGLWAQRAAEDYSVLHSYLLQVENRAVSEHTKLAENVYKTVFENGVGVIVNYGETSAVIDGITVGAGDFVKIGW